MGDAFNSVSNIVAGDNITVDTSDPHNPVVSATGGGGGEFAPLPVDTEQGWQNSVGGYGFGTGSLDGSDFIGVIVQTGDAGTGVSVGNVQTGPAIIIGTPGAEIFNIASGASSISLMVGGGGVAITASDGPFVINSTEPMKLPVTADSDSFEPNEYPGSIVYDSGLGKLRISDGTDWHTIDYGVVQAILPGTGITVDDTDPTAPVVAVSP